MVSHTLHAPAFSRILQRLDAARSVLLLNPEKGDGDSLGATLALAHHLERVGTPHTVYAHRVADPTFSFLPRHGDVRTDPAHLAGERYDLIVAADFADPRMTGITEHLARRDPHRTPLVIIDHHPGNTVDGEERLVDPRYAATCEIVYQLFEHGGLVIDRNVATCLLTGILTDTGAFANRNTTHLSLAIAAELLRRGARMHHIVHHAFRRKPVGVLRLWGDALSRLQRNPATGLVTTFITQDDLTRCGVSDDATEGIANFLNTLDGARAVLVLYETPDGRVKGSFRTTNDDVDVAALAARFGGGGHRRAAGFTVQGRLKEEYGQWSVVEGIGERSAVERTYHAEQDSSRAAYSARGGSE